MKPWKRKARFALGAIVLLFILGSLFISVWNFPSILRTAFEWVITLEGDSFPARMNVFGVMTVLLLLLWVWLFDPIVEWWITLAFRLLSFRFPTRWPKSPIGAKGLLLILLLLIPVSTVAVAN